jgi:hypothetical protein
MNGKKEWMLGLPGHNEVVRLEDVVLLVKGGQLRPTDLVKKLGEPWRAANEVPELLEHFKEPRPSSAPPAPAEAAAPAAKPRLSTPEPARLAATTRSVPKADPPARSTRVPPPEPATSKAARAAAATTERREAPPAPAAPPASAGKPAAAPAPEPAPKGKERTRPVPKPPPKPTPTLEPMVGKYFSPVDMLRAASFAFEPRKLLLSAGLLSPLMIAWSVLFFLSAARTTRGERVLLVAATALLFFGFALVLMALACVSRRQLEGKEYTAGEAFGFTLSNLRTAVVYPVLVMIPSGLSLGVLWLLSFVRNSGSAGASFLKIVYILPMFFAFLAVLGAFVYQLASMYVPAAAAIEGAGLTGAVQAAWLNARRQWGRVVLHWLIVTVAFGVIGAVCLALAWLAIQLPEFIFSPAEAEGAAVAEAWRSYGLVFALYQGLAWGLGLTLPVSLFSTLAALSYVSLRHPASAQLWSSPPDETSGANLPSVPRSASSPMEATQPAETRPAPPDATPPPGDVSDDSDEQPLVKDA